MYFLYILLCEDGSLYTGITINREDRLRRHRNGSGSKYTRGKKAVDIVYTEQHATRKEAAKREVQIKAWPRIKKLELIARSKR